ncbi:MAG: Ig-like domain-containing protein, partial [Cyanobacteria bacterium J06592_8]
FFGLDTFRYLVTDGKGATARGTVNVTIANEVPIAGKDNVIVEEGQTTTIDVLANDTDADGDVLSIDSIFGDGPANGTVEIVDDQILYTPNDGFFGLDTFRYLVTDGKGATARGTVNVTVNEVVQEDPILGDGNYRLGNHPDGNAPGPGYGLRLDGLLTGDANDIFTFDFENSHSNMEMSIAGSGNQISISGTVFGGRVDPVTGEYVEGQSGSWDVDFTYTNVENVSGDDDLSVDDSLAGTNTGTITPQFGNQEVIALEDFAGQNSNTFQLGDLEDDGGFRGFSGVSGWGWLQAGDNRLVDSDWLFTVQEEIVH